MKWTWFVEPKAKPVRVKREEETVPLSAMSLGELLFHALVEEGAVKS